MKQLTFILSIFLILVLGSVKNSFCQEDKFIIVYNNMSAETDLESDWGYAAWIELDGEIYLFDSGTKGDIFKSNLEKLNLDPGKINKVIISHNHYDHIGGLSAISEELKPNTKVYLPEMIDDELLKQMNSLDFQVEKDFKKIGDRIWITRVMENPANRIKEHALVIEKGEKYIIITGCAHPGISGMCKEIADYFQGKTPELVTGGFHLIATSDSNVEEISATLKEIGIEKAGASHCTGEKAISIFQKDWGENFVQLYLGDEYVF
ncbi:MAG: MBL fold metallo-hydrolase [Mariniphaga sp.]|nr:MBL fold metallo-hydrolase [Mariniphaga sp.]